MYKKLWLIILICSIIAFIVYNLLSYTIEYKKPVIEHIEVKEIVKLRPALVPVCACESQQNKNGVPKQFNDDGSVLFGKKNKLDTGMCQINQKYWLKKSEELGFDIFTKQGNIKMANWIYDKNGLKDWNWSKPCWK